ncbi:M1 family metallopeptidase [Crossiella cryophila]|uniref:Aminopeptidase N n=1 Tax=Crossiella cryophila TaxID=43355 RepID=A0A7W7C737_9PSEU|nr:M1 family metallopeptidase [Crossiella cryophila]MBB4674448.1 aminopeptidase N [Crossiella cryophila]
MLRRHSFRVAAAAAAAVALLAWPASAGTDSTGAPGIGDEYYPNDGNGGYDVSHYDIRLKYQPASDTLTGTTTIVASPTQELSRFNLDFALPVKSVRVNGAKATFSQTADAEVVVTPARTAAKGSLLTVVVEYEGIPSQTKVNGQTLWKKTSDGAVAINEPHIARWWFPSNDHPTDKATFDVSVAVPTGVEVISNGALKSRAVQPGGWTRWNWRSTKPQATYLAFLTIGQFEIHQSTGHKGQPFITAYSEGLGEIEGPAKASLERTPEVIEFLETVFGEWPFEAQGGVVPKEGLTFALENQTRPTYAPGFFRNGNNINVVVHELAHQWFGDSVSVAKWRNIWLNEGFATYAPWLWSEHAGEGTAQEWFDFTYARYAENDPFWQVVIGAPGSGNEFHGAVYDRGAMALHAIRKTVGDKVFFQTVKTWTENKKYGNATIEEFKALAEVLSGKKLDEVFNTWLFTKGKPKLTPEVSTQGTERSAKVKEPKNAKKAIENQQILHDLSARAGK